MLRGLSLRDVGRSGLVFERRLTTKVPLRTCMRFRVSLGLVRINYTRVNYIRVKYIRST